MIVFPIQEYFPVEEGNIPAKPPCATGSSLMTWEDLSGYPLDR
jgi:hypothetical protein